MSRPAVALPAIPRSALGGLGVLWRFSRPHTIIGTTVSVLGLAALVADAGASVPLWDLACVLVAAVTVNVFIVGINQLEDVEIDRINKPFLPIAAGELSRAGARRIVAVCAVVPIAMALTQGWLELVAVLAALAAGVAYSSPPLRLKRFPFAAALTISGVRSVIVNLGVALHFSPDAVPGGVWALTLFVLPFAFAIAVLKDVPDADGDRRWGISTFTVRLGGRRAMALGMAALTLAYVGMAVGGTLALDAPLLAVLHLPILALLWSWARRVDADDREAFTAFYLRIWKLFFLAYVLVPAAVLAA